MTKFTGNCLCGDVSFEADGDIAMMGNCHCKDCQQVTGATYATFVFMDKSDFELKGETKRFSHKADSGATLTKHFCPTCSSALYSSHEGRPSMVGILAGSINEQEHVKPQFNVFTCRKLDCTQLDPNIPAFEKLPPG